MNVSSRFIERERHDSHESIPCPTGRDIVGQTLDVHSGAPENSALLLAKIAFAKELMDFVPPFAVPVDQIDARVKEATMVDQTSPTHIVTLTVPTNAIFTDTPRYKRTDW